MYGIPTFGWFFMGTVGIYSIHGSYGKMMFYEAKNPDPSIQWRHFEDPQYAPAKYRFKPFRPRILRVKLNLDMCFCRHVTVLVNFQNVTQQQDWSWHPIHMGSQQWSRISRAAALGMELPYLLAHEDGKTSVCWIFAEYWRHQSVQQTTASAAATTQKCKEAKLLQKFAIKRDTSWTRVGISYYCATPKILTGKKNGHHITTTQLHLFHMGVSGQILAGFTLKRHVTAQTGLHLSIRIPLGC